MKAYTFSDGTLVGYISLGTVINPPLLLLGTLDAETTEVQGSCDIVFIDMRDPPPFAGTEHKIFSRASYFLEMQEGCTHCFLRRESSLPEDTVLVHLTTYGPAADTLGYWEVLAGEPVCLAKGFGVKGKTLFRFPSPGVTWPTYLLSAGKWYEGLLLLSPGDSVAIFSQQPDGAAYCLRYSPERKLLCFPYTKKRMRA